MNPFTIDKPVLYNPVVESVSSPPPGQLAEQRQLIKAVKTLNKSEYFGDNSELTFQVDSATKRPVIKILDKDTKEVIDQIPAEYILAIAHDMQQENG